ncbi:PAS domain-containing sensor histidine kinase, partial [Candidatus Bathyarchaeota archaeon]|nr:PAS domain-containing sensor histidine kinase [Candidatus Bathyarchaeota archaeon]
LISSSTDITERKKAEEALCESEERFKAIVENAPFGYYRVGKDGLWQYVNPVWERMHGFSSKEVVGKPFEITQPEDSVKQAKELVKRALSGESLAGEFGRLTKEGKIEYHRYNIQPIKHGKEIVAIEGFIRDITEPKKMMDALRESEENYRRQFEEASDAIFVADAETGILVDCNPAACELVGRAKSEIVGMHQQILHPPEKNQGEFSRGFREHLGKKKGETLELQVITKSGEIKDVAIKATIFTLGNKTLMHGSFRDITEQKKVEKALREAEEKYRETIVNANIGIIAYDSKGEVKILNPKMEEMTGFTSREIPTLTKWFEKLYPNEEERSKVRDKWFKRMSEEGEVKEGHAITTTKEGKRRNFLFNGFKLKSGDFIAFAQDITERKEAEEKLDKLMNELVMVNEKLNVVGSLTRHDVRNKLCAVTGNAFLLKKKHADQTDILEGLGKMEQACQEIGQIFDFARMYEQLGVEELFYVDVERTVNEAVALFSGLNLKLVNDCHGLSLLADSFLRQLFYNFIDNTIKYGKKTTATRMYFERAESGELRLIYEDDGVGVPLENKPRLFSEGFSTGGSTGFGLFLIKKMMDVYGWQIQETGEPGKGAKFTITIPRLNQKGKENFQIA